MPTEWIVVAVVALVLFGGAKKLPEIARSIGKAKGEFKKGLDEGDADAAKERKAAE
jgi:sec-independent protein translocase protein TatA